MLLCILFIHNICIYICISHSFYDNKKQINRVDTIFRQYDLNGELVLLQHIQLITVKYYFSIYTSLIFILFYIVTYLNIFKLFFWPSLLVIIIIITYQNYLWQRINGYYYIDLLPNALFEGSGSARQIVRKRGQVVV